MRTHSQLTTIETLKAALWRLRIKAQTLQDGTRLGCWCPDNPH